MLEFDNAALKKEWLDGIKEAMTDFAANVNQAVLVPPEPGMHACQIGPRF